MQPGKFISVEGIEGAGKSTLLTFIKKYLSSRHFPVHVTQEPGGTIIGEAIRQLVLHPPATAEALSPETELLLMFAARMQHLTHGILPLLEKGTWVISDRFIDASYAYQGGGRGIATHYIAWLDHWIVHDHYPDLTLLLDLAPGLSEQRLKQRTIHDRIEQEECHFFTRVRQRYLTRANHDPTRIKLIDVSHSLTQVKQKVRTILDAFINQGPCYSSEPFSPEV